MREEFATWRFITPSPPHSRSTSPTLASVADILLPTVISIRTRSHTTFESEGASFMTTYCTKSHTPCNTTPVGLLLSRSKGIKHNIQREAMQVLLNARYIYGGGTGGQLGRRGTNRQKPWLRKSHAPGDGPINPGRCAAAPAVSARTCPG